MVVLYAFRSEIRTEVEVGLARGASGRGSAAGTTIGGCSGIKGVELGPDGVTSDILEQEDMLELSEVTSSQLRLEDATLSKS